MVFGVEAVPQEAMVEVQPLLTDVIVHRICDYNFFFVIVATVL